MTLPSTVNGSRRATIAAIAEEVGVSVATVSKVLNGRGDVGEETRTRVEASLELHSYRRRGKRKPSATGHIELVFHTLGADWAMVKKLGRGVRLPPLMFSAAEALGLVMAVLDGHHDAGDPTDPVEESEGGTQEGR